MESVSNSNKRADHGCAKPRLCLPTALLSLFFALCIVWGWQLHATRDVAFKSPLHIGLIMVLSSLIYTLIGRLFAQTALRGFGEGDREASCSSLWLPLSFIAACWLLVWLAAWPGYYSYDTVHYTNFLSSGVLSSQQSVFHTISVGVFLRIGLVLFDDFNAGVALYVGFQFIVCLGLVARILSIVRNIAPRAIYFVATAFYSLCPAISLFVLCTTKDVMFSIFLINYCLECYLIICKGELRISRFLAIGALVFLVAAERNNGLYALVLSSPIVGWQLYKASNIHAVKFYLVAVFAGLACSLLWIGPISNCLGVSQANSFKEMISIPVVQLARANMDDEQVTNLIEDMGVDSSALVSSYVGSPDNSDATRTYFWPLIEQGGVSDLIKAWASELPTHLRSYLVGLLALTESAWSPFAYSAVYNKPGAMYEYDVTEASTFAAWVEDPAVFDSKLPFLSSLLWRYSRGDPFKTYPLFAWTSSVSFYFWLLLLALLRCICGQRRSGLCYCAILLCVACTSLLGPCVLLRYYWFLVFTAPLLLCFLLLPYRAWERKESTWGLTKTCLSLSQAPTMQIIRAACLTIFDKILPLMCFGL